jgi:hypothetical protein
MNAQAFKCSSKEEDWSKALPLEAPAAVPKDNITSGLKQLHHSGAVVEAQAVLMGCIALLHDIGTSSIGSSYPHSSMTLMIP